MATGIRGWSVIIRVAHAGMLWQKKKKKNHQSHACLAQFDQTNATDTGRATRTCNSLARDTRSCPGSVAKRLLNFVGSFEHRCTAPTDIQVQFCVFSFATRVLPYNWPAVLEIQLSAVTSALAIWYRLSASTLPHLVLPLAVAVRELHLAITLTIL